MAALLRFSLALAVLPFLAHGAEADVTRAAGRRMVWHDEFEGNALDKSKWQVWGTMSSTDNVYANDERTMGVKNGYLRLRILPSGVTNKVALIPRGLVTRDRMSFRYGYLNRQGTVPSLSGDSPSVLPDFSENEP